MFRRKETAEDESVVVKRIIELDEDVRQKFGEIIEMCNEVYVGMRKGFAEAVYEEALCIELQMRGIQYTHQETLPCVYKGRFVGNIRLDILLNSWLPFIFELKATASHIQTDERWQLVRYMSRKDVPYGAVVNFHQGITKGLDMSFVVRQEDGYYIYDPETCEGRRLRDA
jgi:GxxExxY protein